MKNSTAKDRNQIHKDVMKRINRYFRKEQEKRRDQMINELRKEGSDPYTHNPSTEVEQIERRAFDVCALTIGKHLDSFHNGMDVGGRRLLLRMVKEAITNEPSEVGRILREVLKLPKEEIKDFASLIEDIPLSHLVKAAKMIRDRIDSLEALEAVIHLDPFTTTVKERAHLQHLIDSNTWIFGEEYALGTSDKNIRKLLEQHVGILERDSIQPKVSNTHLQKLLKKESKKSKENMELIPDIMIWKRFIERKPQEYEFLVVELKRPNVSIGRKEIQQIEDYALAVSSSNFSDKERTQWVFAVVSDSLDEQAKLRASQQELGRNVILKSSDPKFEVRAYPWSTIIRSARARHEYLRKELQHEPSLEKALKSTGGILEELKLKN